MRVSKSGSRRGQIVRKKDKSKSAPLKPVFSDILQAERVEQFDLDQALQEIDKYAERLRKNPVIENLLRYKKKIQAVLQFLIEQSYGVAESTFYDPSGRRRLLMIVETIDEKLEGLARAFLEAQVDNLELACRLDEIRGLLLDLYS